MPVRVKETELRRLRCSSQGMSERTHTSPVTAIRHLLAMQGQDLPGAKWSIGLRVPGCTLADVDAAFSSGQILRSWSMRGTLHVVAAEDLGWMLALTTPRMLASTAARQRQLEIDEHTVETARGVAIGALGGGRALGRDGLMRAFESAGIRTTGQRGYYLIWVLAQTGTLCWGPPAGANAQSLVLLDEWVRAPRVLERDEALREFVLRYLGGHGPATMHDFAWWTKLTMAEAKSGWALAGDELTEVVSGDASYWMLTAHLDEASEAGNRRAVYALPGFDEYLLGYQNRSVVLDPEHAPRIVPGNNGMFMPTIVHGGRVVGTWRKKPRRSAGSDPRLLVEPLPFYPLSSVALAGFGAAARRYGRFLGTLVDVSNPL